MADAFSAIAQSYDRWYDEPEGASVFAAELECLRAVMPEVEGPWLEIGVGTARFAAALGIRHGLDPSTDMLRIAAGRGVYAMRGRGETLPFATNSFHGVLLVATLCFVEDAPQVLCEATRTLKPGGALLIGHIPADGPWGRAYARRAASGHPLYSRAHFTTAVELVRLATDAGYTLQRAAATLFHEPGSPPAPVRVEPGIASGAGFLALAFAPTRLRPGEAPDTHEV